MHLCTRFWAQLLKSPIVVIGSLRVTASSMVGMYCVSDFLAHTTNDSLREPHKQPKLQPLSCKCRNPCHLVHLMSVCALREKVNTSRILAAVALVALPRRTGRTDGTDGQTGRADGRTGRTDGWDGRDGRTDGRRTDGRTIFDFQFLNFGF